MMHRPRITLAQLPTPLHPLPHLSAFVGGPEIWVKRDDQTGLAFGGNKTRKLERLVGQAHDESAEVLLTRGARQSNHCRQTAAAAAFAGMECTLILSGEPPDTINANLLLDHLLGAEIIWAGSDDPEQTLQQTFQEKIKAGKKAFLIPYGGSSPLGASAYSDAVDEVITQGEHFDRVLFATSSGGTQAGLIAGARRHGLNTIIDGISVDQGASELSIQVAELATSILKLMDEDGDIKQKDVLVDDRFLGEGYAVVGTLEREAIRLFARHEGLLLDPVYTGRAAGGMLSKIRSGEISANERVLFWHTGGTPALFAFADMLLNE
jgi:D-cysteine desulfhydrase family pyridoxal phosphate-dependent enzyme